jgi:methionyl-tRNA formyltransferase
VVALFLGTPEFAVPSLEALHAAGFAIPAVYTQPDRPKGRGRQLAPPPVKEAALQLGLKVLQPERIRRPEVVDEIRAFAPEIMVVVGYGQIIPRPIIDIPRLGILNVHASLLPKYRGAAPIQWAIAYGESETGVTIMRIDAGLDTGDTLAFARTSIGPEETAPELSRRLAALGAQLLIDTLAAYAHGRLLPVPQDHEAATLAPILTKEDARIDFSQPAATIYNRLRGFTPWPGAHTTFRGATLKILAARPAPEPSTAPPGTLLFSNRRLLAACGQNTSLELLELQPEGRNKVSAESFANGARLAQNEILGS